METPLSKRPTLKKCRNIKVQRQEKIKEDLIKNLFARYINENVVIFIKHKHLPKLMKKRCYGCINDRLSQRDHDCLLLTTEEWLDMFLEKLIKKIDFRLINNLAMNRLCGDFRPTEIKHTINHFNTLDFYLEDKQWCQLIKTKIVATD